MNLNIEILKDKYAIYKLTPDSEIPSWIKDLDFYSITKTRDELSLVCKQNDSLNDAFEINKNWKILKIIGHLDLSIIGVIAEISRILKENKISIFTISTYDTDYVLVKERDLNRAVDSLKANGHIIFSGDAI
jgi:hypothetical protein